MNYVINVVSLLLLINYISCLTEIPSNITHLRVKRQSSCGLNEYKCKSGECLSTLDLCDNVPNCKDGSDETSEACANYNCPKFTYKCAYGGCIFEEGRCDGKNDCLDNSDEANCNPITTKTPLIVDDKNYCFLPEAPENGFLYVEGIEDNKYRLADKVPEGTKLTFKCGIQHELNPNITITCSQKQWSDDVPKCEKACDKIYVYNILVKCYRNGRVVNCHPAFNGTRVKSTCVRFREEMNVTEHYYTNCINGNWDSRFHLCEQKHGGFLIPPARNCDPSKFFTCDYLVTDDFECIPKEGLCDGKLDCLNRNDETEKYCADFKCPPHKFRCAYGGCVHGKARCNGIKECIDNSDEEGCPPLARPCIIPNAPENGFVSVQGFKGSNYVPGDEVSQGTMLTYRCKLGYELMDSTNVTFCIGGKWLSERPKCEKTCLPIRANNQFQAKCYRDENVVDCTKPFNQTRAKLHCSLYYEDPSLNLFPYRYCLNGNWDKNLPNCVPECGQKFVEAQTLLIGGQISARDHWPWSVGIYYKADKQQICGGSILNQKVVLSAAHCFVDSSDNALPPELYTIAGGKHYRQFNHADDRLAQYSDVDKIYIPKEYQGADQNYRADIAVVILKEQFILSANIRPVCLDWGPTFEIEQYNTQKTGIVLGWGLTAEGGKPSDELKELEMPYHEINECTEHLQLNYRRFATTGDKLCGGYVNKSSSACQGDSGGGYVFRRGDKYFIRGIVSVAPKTPSGNCDSNLYTLFTQVSKYNDFIYKYESLYRPI